MERAKYSGIPPDSLIGTIPIEIANCPALVILVQYVPKSHNISCSFLLLQNAE